MRPKLVGDYENAEISMRKYLRINPTATLAKVMSGFPPMIVDAVADWLEKMVDAGLPRK